jgi:hypothetical protein
MTVRRIALYCSLTVAVALTWCAAAQAAPRPKLNLALPPVGADAGSPSAYIWTARDTRPGSLVLQRQLGTAKIWRTISRLHGTSGSGQIPALPLGSYRLRIANIGPKPKHKLWAFQQRTLRVFGPVPLGTLLGIASDQTITLPTSVFSYVLAASAYPNPAVGVTLTDTHTTCRSVHLDFAANSDQYGHDAGRAEVSVVQSAADPVSASTAPKSSSSLDTALTPGLAWSVMFRAVDVDRASYLAVYLNGTASCFGSQQELNQKSP